MPILRRRNPIGEGIGAGIEAFGNALGQKQQLDMAAAEKAAAQRQQMLEFQQRQEQADQAHQDQMAEFAASHGDVIQNMIDNGATNYRGLDLTPFKPSAQTVAKPFEAQIQSASTPEDIQNALAAYQARVNKPAYQLAQEKDPVWQTIGDLANKVNKHVIDKQNAAEAAKPHYDSTGTQVETVNGQTTQVGESPTQAAAKAKLTAAATAQGQMDPAAVNAEIDKFRREEQIRADIAAKAAAKKDTANKLKASQTAMQAAQLANISVAQLQDLWRKASNEASPTQYIGASGIPFVDALAKSGVSKLGDTVNSYLQPNTYQYTTSLKGLAPTLFPALGGKSRFSEQEREALEALMPSIGTEPRAAAQKWQHLREVINLGPLLAQIPADENDPEDMIKRLGTADRWIQMMHNAKPGMASVTDPDTGIEIPLNRGGK